MVRTTRILLYAAPAVLVFGALAVAAAAPDGKDVFMAKKCDTCHSVSTAGIAATTKSEKMKGPDLVGVMQAHDSAWLAKWLKKEIDIDGKKHPKTWDGTDDEFKALVSFLEAQKKK